MTKKLSAKRRKEYLRNPNFCPYCKSDNICTGEFDACFNSATQKVYCNDCEEQWQDVYEMIDVDPVS